MKAWNRRAALAATAGLLLATGAAAQSRTVTIELKKLFPYLDAYYTIPAPERSRFTLAYYVRPAGVPIRIAGQEAPIGADGRILRLPTAQQLAAKQTATLEGGKGTKFDVSMELEPTMRPSTRMDAAELAAAVDQANRGIKRAAPAAIRFVVPKMAAVKFTGGGSGEVLMTGGRRAPLPVVEGHPRFEPAAFAGAETVVLARTPTRLEIGPASKPKKKR